jgi:transketolase
MQPAALRAFDDLDRLSANTIRALAMDAVQRANSGHPGAPLGLADIAHVLWTRDLVFDPGAPEWANRDRFVLSNGHSSMLLYALLHLSGYDLTLEQLREFRQWDSKTPGHPENVLTPGVEVTSGPLGQGFGNSVGLALAERVLAERFNRPGYPLFDHYTYVICSDGDLMEGISHEAASLAGHLRLGRLIAIYDDNEISIDGSTDLSYTEDVPARFRAYGWHVQQIDGHDLFAVATALAAARAETGRPSLIAAHTHIGYGSPNKQDTAKAHGEPLGEDEVRRTKENLGWPWPDQTFVVPPQVVEHYRAAADRGVEAHRNWEGLLAEYAQEYPEEAAQLRAQLAGELPAGWDRDLPEFPSDKPMATRSASGKVLDVLAARIPALIGGSADLTPSNNTKAQGWEPIAPGRYSGRYIHYGVREHAMAACMNGLALHGGLRPYGGTFLIFSDYMRPSVRLAALSHIGVIFVFTHDSIGLGEDGPTHQPIEQLAGLRAIPNLLVVRPADAGETVEAWKLALARRDGPTALALTRQALPVLARSGPGALAPAAGLQRGGYVLSDVADPDTLLLASGSEVHLALAAQALLAARGGRARVISMPCPTLFDRQPLEYREQVLPAGITRRVAVEAAAPLGWERYTGLGGAVIGLERFGASAPYQTIYAHLGLTAERIADTALRLA